MSIMRFSQIWVPILLVASGACRSSDRVPAATVLAEVRRQLEVRGREDQEVREGVFGPGGAIDSAKGAQMLRTDSANTTWL